MSLDDVDVRLIEAGDAPTRFARGWHCLGLTKDLGDGKPHSIDTVVLSTQHSPDQSESMTKLKPSFYEAVIEEIIKPVLPKGCFKFLKCICKPANK